MNDVASTIPMPELRFDENVGRERRKVGQELGRGGLREVSVREMPGAVTESADLSHDCQGASGEDLRVIREPVVNANPRHPAPVDKLWISVIA